MSLEQTFDEILPADLSTLTQEQILEKCTRLISSYVKLLGCHTEKQSLLSAQKSLMIFRRSGDSAKDVDNFRHALLSSDEIFGEEWGGFSRLFESIICAGEINLEAAGDVFQVVQDSGQNHSDLRLTAEKLRILHEIADSFSVNSDVAAGCIVLSGVNEALKVRYLHQADPKADWEEKLDDWIYFSSCTLALSELWCLRIFIKEISSQVLLYLEDMTKARSFCLWFLSHRLIENIAIEGFTRRLLDTLLARAKLAPLSVFESAGLLS